MNTLRTLTTLLLTGILASQVGCVSPGRIDSTVLNKYQERIARRHTPRSGGSSLDMLRPAKTIGGVSLDVHKDPKTRKTTIKLSLRDAVRIALGNNLDIRIVAFDPEISRAEAMGAAAVFDSVLFGEYSYTDAERRNNTTDTIFSPMISKSQRRLWALGLRKRMVTGADVAATYRLERTWSGDRGSSRKWTTAYEGALSLEVTQPLLRNAWLAVNLSTVRVARLNRRISEEMFRQRVEEVVTNVVTTYWGLIRARLDVQIQRELLANTKDTQKRVKARSEVDATTVQVKQAESAVETRRASLIRAQKSILDVQDTMARLLNDSRISLLDDYEIVPLTKPYDKPMSVNMADQLSMALEHNPLLVQARLAIDSADISVVVARNGVLPQLDLSATAQFQGLTENARKTNDQVLDGKQGIYTVGLLFEFPLGNRSARANLRRSRLKQRKAITELRNLALSVVQTVKERGRQIETTFQELQAQKAAVDAARIQLRAVEDTEKIRGKLSPEFLELKLRTQESLANTQRGELEVLINYNVAMITLSQATGTVLRCYGVELVATGPSPVKSKSQPKKRAAAPSPVKSQPKK